MEFRRQALKQVCRVSVGQYPYESDHSNWKSIEIAGATVSSDIATDFNQGPADHTAIGRDRIEIEIII